MKFVDQVRIFVKAGDGGHGAVAFRREKYIERGGPNGGDGGNGGSIIFVADHQLTTLLDFRYQQHHRGQTGENGMGNDCNGRKGEDLILKVPVGTLVKDEPTGDLLMDLSEDGQQYVVAKGGRGGLGNMNFATSTRQAPRFAQEGTKGEERTILLELKLLADVGLIGFPNAGKSTLVSRVSRARPKIADYPFTTLVPNLGMVQYKDGKSFVIADIPGLIEGASEGHGLGHQFLRHVERCKVLVHLIDLGAEGEGRSPLADFDIINNELARYSATLAEKPQIVAPNKIDLTHGRERLVELEAELKKRGIAVFPISSATGEGIQRVLDIAAQVLFTGNLGPLQLPVPRSAARAAPAQKASAAAPSTKGSGKRPASAAPSPKVTAKKPASAAPKRKKAAAERPAKMSKLKRDPGGRKKTVRKAPVKRAVKRGKR